MHKLALVLGIVIVSVSGGIYFISASNDISSETILETSTTVIGQTISYPEGSAMITSKIITLPVGTETGDHIHEYPMFGYVLEGEITVDYGEHGFKTYLVGDSLIEAINFTHNGKNTGDIPAKILVVLMSEKNDQN